MRIPRSGPLSPDEFQKQLSDFMRQHFQGFRVTPFASAATGAGSSESQGKSARPEFHFDKTPHQVKAYLDRFVIQQEEAKKVLSVALCDHYHHLRLAQEGKEQPN